MTPPFSFIYHQRNHIKPEFLAIKHESRILGHSSNQPCMLFIRDLCCLAHGELAWLFLEPDTGLHHCPIILLSCFRARTSGGTGIEMRSEKLLWEGEIVSELEPKDTSVLGRTDPSTLVEWDTDSGRRRAACPFSFKSALMEYNVESVKSNSKSGS